MYLLGTGNNLARQRGRSAPWGCRLSRVESINTCSALAYGLEEGHRAAAVGRPRRKPGSAFAKRATNVRVDRTAHQISVSPNLRDKASFVHVPEKVIRLVAPDAANLGVVVAAALQAGQSGGEESAP